MKINSLKLILIFITVLIAMSCSTMAKFHKKEKNIYKNKFDTISTINDSTTYINVKYLINDSLATTTEMFFIYQYKKRNNFTKVEVEYYKTIMHGKSTEYYVSSLKKCAEGTYTNGVKNNDWKYWNENGVEIDFYPFPNACHKIMGDGFIILESLKKNK